MVKDMPPRVLPPPKPTWLEVARRKGKRDPMGEQAFAAGLINVSTAERFKNGTAGPDVVAVIKTVLSKTRGLPSAKEKGNPALLAREPWTWGKSPSTAVSPCWSCGEIGHFQSSCPRFSMWSCSSCLTDNAAKHSRCNACLRAPSAHPTGDMDLVREPPILEAGADSAEDGSAAAPCAQDAGSSQPAALYKILVELKGMAPDEAHGVLRDIGMPPPPVLKKPVRQQDDVSALKDKIQALQRRQKAHDGLQKEMASLQEKLLSNTKIIAVLEEDISRLRHEVSIGGSVAPQEKAAEVGVGLSSEAAAIAKAFEHMSSVLICPNTLQEKYIEYSRIASTEGAQPLPQLAWIAQETAVAMQSGTTALAAIRAAQEEYDHRSRPRKTARLGSSDALAIARPAFSGSLAAVQGR